MLLYADQPTPPFNSPYQQHVTTRTTPLLETPYPSPGQPEHRSKYPHGLGLHNYQQPMTAGLPPSPQPSEAWGSHFSTGTSPLITEAIADPWSSGAFDHPVSRSPLPWISSQTSPRSSLSSYTREMSAFSHEGSEHTLPVVKVEASRWNPEVSFHVNTTAEMNDLPSLRGYPLTVAPERLSTGVYPYDNTYDCSPMPKYESVHIHEYGVPKFVRSPSEDSITSIHSSLRHAFTTGGSRDRIRNRRHTDPANASYHCPLCPEKGFARKYNYNQHMLTHDTYRKKENVCMRSGCGKEFVRKTDLARHDQSVHQRAKPFKCARCPSAFSRKDTLRRHEDDGCPRRNIIPGKDSQILLQLRNEGYEPSAGI